MKRLSLLLLGLAVTGSLPAAAQITTATFQPGVLWDLYTPRGVESYFSSATADLNGDGAPDLISYQGIVSLNDGRGVFSPFDTLRTLLPVPGQGGVVGETADFDGDGDTDCLLWRLPGTGAGPTDSVELHMLHNDGRGHLTPVARLPWPGRAGMAEFTILDYDGDQRPDLLYTINEPRPFRSTLRILLNNGQGTAFRVQELPYPGGNLHWVRGADLDGDQRPELLHFAARVDSLPAIDTLVVWRNGGGVWQPQSPLRFPAHTMLYPYPSFGDLTGDGAVDLLGAWATMSDSLRLTPWVNDGTGQFSPGPAQVLARLTADPYHRTPYQLDLDADGDRDLLVQEWTTLRVLENTGNGRFAPGPTIFQLTTGNPQLNIVVPLDADRDGDLDLLVDYYEDVDHWALLLLNQTRTPLGLPAAAPGAPLTLAPNPAHGTVRVGGGGAAGQPVQVLDALGRVVRTAALAARAATLELSLEGLTPGVYTVRVGAAARRLVVE